MATARMDLDNTHGNSQYGVHTAAMAGTWLCVVYGFAGMRVSQGALHFAPYLPDHWSHYQFTIRFRDQVLQVRVSGTMAEYRLVEGTLLECTDHDRAIRLTAETPVQAVSMDEVSG